MLVGPSIFLENIFELLAQDQLPSTMQNLSQSSLEMHKLMALQGEGDPKYMNYVGTVDIIRKNLTETFLRPA